MRTTTVGPEDEKQVWLRAQPLLDAQVFVWALVLGLLVGVCGVGLDRLVHQTSRIYASDLYTCIVSMVFLYLLMVFEKRRRMVLARRMEIVAEANHHIRNALTAVVFSASVQNDPALQAVLNDATERIDWVLTKVLPDGEAALKWPVQSQEWRPGVWPGGNAQPSKSGR